MARDDPTPCLCGVLPADECANTSAPLHGACAGQYASAAVGFPGTIFTQFFEPTTPIGIADHLVSCDANTPCRSVCPP
jgi:hypothetical protein